MLLKTLLAYTLHYVSVFVLMYAACECDYNLRTCACMCLCGRSDHHACSHTHTHTHVCTICAHVQEYMCVLGCMDAYLRTWRYACTMYTHMCVMRAHTQYTYKTWCVYILSRLYTLSCTCAYIHACVCVIVGIGMRTGSHMTMWPCSHTNTKSYWRSSACMKIELYCESLYISHPACF